MCGLRAIVVAVLGASALAFASGTAAWWEAESSSGDTDTSSGSWGWGSFVNVYDNAEQLVGLTGPDPNAPGCATNNPNDFCPQINLIDYLGNVPTPSMLLTCPDGDQVPEGSGNCDCGNEVTPASISAKFVASPIADTPRVAFCVVSDDEGNLLFNTATYCEVDVTVLEVVGTTTDGKCTYTRSLAPGDLGEDVFKQSAAEVQSFVRLLPPLQWPDNVETDLTEPRDVPSCADVGGAIPADGCALPVGLPLGEVCKNQNCVDRLLPATDPLSTGEVMRAEETGAFAVFKSCPGDVDGGADSIACKGGNKKVETYETDVVIECSGNYEPAGSGSASNELNAAGNNTTQFDFLSDCMPSDILTSEPITVQGIVIFSGNDEVRSSTPGVGCSLIGDTTVPDALRCLVDEQELAQGCEPNEGLNEVQAGPDDGDASTGFLNKIQGVAKIQITPVEGEPNVVKLIATDDNDGSGFVCTNLDKLP